MCVIKPCWLNLYLFQVIGTLPLLVNPASLAGGATTPALPTQGLQVQTVSPQLLVNAQGQIIATFGNGPAQVPTSSTVLSKPAAALTLTKPASQVLPTSSLPMCVGRVLIWDTKMDWHERQLRCSAELSSVTKAIDFMLNTICKLKRIICTLIIAEHYCKHIFWLQVHVRLQLQM